MIVDESACRPFFEIRSCEGAVLEPGGPSCHTGVGVAPDGPPLSGGGPDSENRTGIIRLELSATCTTRVGQPCASLPRQYSPSPASPIEVTWTDGGMERTVTVRRTSSPSTSPETSGGGTTGPTSAPTTEGPTAPTS
jgi:hypothetical protein